ncbi:MAG: TMEM175 family protein [Thermoanaerobaculia bacterium]
MLREKLVQQHHAHKPHEFRWRSREISRLEGLSDAIFGFAVTLLIVALEVPKTSGELLETMRGFVSFGLTFAILYMLWYRQFLFFRRYGLEDTVTVVLNGLLLFVVLFFVFPLKFLLGALVDWFLWGQRTVRLRDGTVERIIQPENFPAMLAIYSLGFSAIFGVFTLFYLHAYRKRRELELNELELLDTLQAIQTFGYAAGMTLLIPLYGLVTVLVAGKPYEDRAVLAATVVLFAAILFVSRLRFKRRRRRRELVARMAALGGDGAVRAEPGVES